MRRSGFRGCVGFIDGTGIPLHQKPHTKDPETWFCYKKFYGFNALLVCDDKRRIIYYHIGSVASNHDSTVFKRTHLYKQPERFFSKGEYLLADSGFALTKRMVTPYSGRSIVGPMKIKYNLNLTSTRVVSEQMNSILKG
ncbi:hypothetical protein CcCBS67573_g10535 [Chytriomyces confervae]|uniref:DDE Tnp4 domain-containing protein n=1 Tax=Chytriomyces confervae TaxID=246404 RepID=A0A507CSP6_9FUNG|nr:hypothetical protein CcCBS67573_g10535 [Chytriomyces confervae]